MVKKKFLLIFGTLLITILLSACSVALVKQTRGIAASDLEILFDEFKSHYEAELSLERKIEITIKREDQSIDLCEYL